MQQKKSSKLLVLMLAMLCLLAAAMTAMAEEIWQPQSYQTLKPVPVDRIIEGLPKGMVATCKKSPGMIEYVIDAEKTDWESVLAYSYQTSSGQAYIFPGIKKPDQINGETVVGQRTQNYSVDPYNSENYILNRISYDYNRNGIMSQGNAMGNHWIGRYQEATSTYMPLEYDDPRRPMAMATCWYNDYTAGAGGERIASEYLLYTISYTDTDARTVNLMKVPASDITPNVKQGAAVNSSKENGTVRYHVSKPENLSSNQKAFTAIAAPKITGKDTLNWTCRWSFSHRNEFQNCEMADAGEYGLKRRSALIEHSLDIRDSIDQESYTLEWCDEHGATQLVYHLSSLVVRGDLAPWPTYENWKTVPSGRLTMTYQNPIASGTKMTYNDKTGIAYFHIKPEELPETANYANAMMQLKIAPYEGAAAYAIFNGNGTDEFGESSFADDVQNEFDSKKRYPVSRELVINQPLFETYRRNSEDLTLYMSAMMPNEFAAEYTIINWYRNIGDKEPMHTEYVFRQMDNCLLRHSSNPYNSEADLPSRLTAPVVVIPNYNSAALMQFVAEIYPIESENARYYELRLIDQNGKTAHLPTNAKIIMRYPEGITFDEAANIVFDLRHLNNKHQTIETFSVANGRLHLEKDYLWFTPSSLSPFILEWTRVDSANLPETGDSSWPLMLLVMLGAISSVLFVQLKRRRA